MSGSESTGSGVDAPAEYENIVLHTQNIGPRAAPRQLCGMFFSQRGKRPSVGDTPGARAPMAGCDHGLMSEPLASRSPVPALPSAVLRPSRAALIAVFFALVGLSPAAFSRPALFGWLVVVPVFATVWILRVSTRVDTTGVHVQRLGSGRTVEWAQISGVRFPRRHSGRFGHFGTAVLTDSSELRMPCVTFRDLPALSAASDGRIPDPFAAHRLDTSHRGSGQ